jgi:hypothetical protein
MTCLWCDLEYKEDIWDFGLVTGFIPLFIVPLSVTDNMCFTVITAYVTHKAQLDL